MGSNRNRGFARFLAVLVLAGAAVSVAFAAEYAAMPEPAVQSEAPSHSVDRSHKTDSLRAPRLQETVAPERSKRIEDPIRTFRGRSALA